MSQIKERNFSEQEIKEIQRILRRIHTAWCTALDTVDFWQSNPSIGDVTDRAHAPFDCMMMALKIKSDGIGDEIDIIRELLDLPHSLCVSSEDRDESWLPTLQKDWENRDLRNQKAINHV